MSTKEDPATPAFWDARFRDKRTPWDAGSTPPDLERYLAQESGGGRVLIPGCGSAFEARTFSEKGYEVVARRLAFHGKCLAITRHDFQEDAP